MTTPSSTLSWWTGAGSPPRRMRRFPRRPRMGVGQGEQVVFAEITQRGPDLGEQPGVRDYPA